MNHVIQAWNDNGLPPDVPFFMTEGNDLGDGGAGTVKSGLWLADYVGAMMTAGAGGTYYFHYMAPQEAAVPADSCQSTKTTTSRAIPRNIWRRR